MFTLHHAPPCFQWNWSWMPRLGASGAMGDMTEKAVGGALIVLSATIFGYYSMWVLITVSNARLRLVEFVFSARPSSIHVFVFPSAAVSCRQPLHQRPVPTEDIRRNRTRSSWCVAACCYSHILRNGLTITKQEEED